MLWAYFSFSQYLIIWSGNLPEEIAWYLHRLQTGWRSVGAHAGRLSISPRRSSCCCRARQAAAGAARQGRDRASCRAARRSVLADRAGVPPRRPRRQLAGHRAAARRSARSGSAASSGSCAAARFCRSTIRSSTKRSAASSSAARRRGRLIEPWPTMNAQHPSTLTTTRAVSTRGERRQHPRDLRRSAPALIVMRGGGATSLICVLFGYFDSREGAQTRTAAYPLAAEQGDRVPPEPRLQTDPRQDLRDLRAKEDDAARLRLGGPERRRRADPDRRGDEADAASAVLPARAAGASDAALTSTQRTPGTRSLISFFRKVFFFVSFVSSVLSPPQARPR